MFSFLLSLLFLMGPFGPAAPEGGRGNRNPRSRKKKQKNSNPPFPYREDLFLVKILNFVRQKYCCWEGQKFVKSCASPSSHPRHLAAVQLLEQSGLTPSCVPSSGRSVALLTSGGGREGERWLWSRRRRRWSLLPTHLKWGGGGGGGWGHPQIMPPPAVLSRSRANGSEEKITNAK